MKAYLVVFDWSADDCESVDIEVFDTFQKAFNRFNEIITNEKNPNVSWIGEYAVDANGEIKDDYEFEEHIETDGTDEFACWWNVTDKNDWYQHDFLSIQIKEVK